KPESVAILLQHKANPNIQNNPGFTPLDLAKKGEETEVIGGEMFGKNGIRRSASGELQKKIADLLIQAGGLANLPKRDRIEVRRGVSGDSTTFYKDQAGRNHYSLLETIATTYGLLSQNDSGTWSHD